MQPLSRAFYNRDAVLVARECLGKLLVRSGRGGRVVGRIVEAEAYLSRDDSACHAFKGLNRKNATMFGPPGHAYVYVIHARHCVNLVTEGSRGASAVLIRALEPLAGLKAMANRRGKDDLGELARGPAKLCEALDIDRALNGWDLTLGRKLWLADDGFAAPEIKVSPRIGVTSAHDLPLRFYLPRNRFVSRLTRAERQP